MASSSSFCRRRRLCLEFVLDILVICLKLKGKFILTFFINYFKSVTKSAKRFIFSALSSSIFSSFSFLFSLYTKIILF